MTRTFFSLLLIGFVLNACDTAPERTKLTSFRPESPKLVVGIVVDQMRYDYLTRFESHYSEGGFKRMLREGFN